MLTLGCLLFQILHFSSIFQTEDIKCQCLTGIIFIPVAGSNADQQLL